MQAFEYRSTQMLPNPRLRPLTTKSETSKRASSTFKPSGPSAASLLDKLHGQEHTRRSNYTNPCFAQVSTEPRTSPVWGVSALVLEQLDFHPLVYSGSANAKRRGLRAQLGEHAHDRAIAWSVRKARRAGSQRKRCWHLVPYPRHETFDEILRHSPRRVAQPSSKRDGRMTNRLQPRSRLRKYVQRPIRMTTQLWRPMPIFVRALQEVLYISISSPSI